MTGLTNEGDLLLETGIVPQGLGDEKASLLVRLALGGVGKEEAHLSGLRDGQRVVLVHDGLPACLGINAQAVVQTEGDIEAGAQLVTEFGGNEQTALGVNGMYIFSYHRAHLAPFSSFLLHFAPLDYTIQDFGRKSNPLSRIFLSEKQGNFAENLGNFEY